VDLDGNAKVMLSPSNHANGQTADLSGNMLSCDTTGRDIKLISPSDKKVTQLISSYKGHQLNSPNDVVVKSDGTIWFTDPSYGCIQFPEQICTLPGDVYRFDPKTAELDSVLTGLDKPNGLAFSIDEQTLYVIDSGAIHADFNASRPHLVNAYDVVDGKSLRNGRLFADITPGIPDGIRLDTEGRLYVTAGDGVQVFRPDGTMIGKIHTPPYPSKFAPLAPDYGQCSNLEFSGKDRSILALAAGPYVWSVQLNVTGWVKKKHTLLY